MKKKKISGKLNSKVDAMLINSYKRGGYAKDLKKPYIWMFPNNVNKRRIEIKMNTWYGVIGSKGHWYCSIKEQDNYILAKDSDTNEYYWTVPWDQEQIKGISGRYWSDSFSTIEEAKTAIIKILNEWNILNNSDYEIINYLDNDEIEALIQLYGRHIGD